MTKKPFGLQEAAEEARRLYRHNHPELRELFAAEDALKEAYLSGCSPAVELQHIAAVSSAKRKADLAAGGAR